MRPDALHHLSRKASKTKSRTNAREEPASLDVAVTIPTLTALLQLLYQQRKCSVIWLSR